MAVIRERYLRDDVPCGLSPCNLCGSGISTKKTLSIRGSGELEQFPPGHLLIPDTNVFLHQVRGIVIHGFVSISSFYSQMDLLESNLFSPPILLLQTVIDEVRHRSLPLYNRLKALIESEDKNIFVFYNEYRM